MKEEAVTVNGLKLIFISKIREMSLQRFSVCGERNTYTDSCGSSFLFFSLHEQIQEYFCLSIVAPVGKVALIFIIKMKKKEKSSQTYFSTFFIPVASHQTLIRFIHLHWGNLNNCSQTNVALACTTI